jgi:Tc toxin complex TcA C-terminal TcB-binding domain
MYELALCMGRQAERAFNYERGFLSRKFIRDACWDNLHDGLLCGEHLSLSLSHMEKSYLEENIREYELTKHFSLRLMFPFAFLSLKEEGHCEIELPEWLFDLDYPGQYMRRIKNVSLSIPCVTGPYTGIHCRLTLLDAKTRVHPNLMTPPKDCCTCCHDENGYSHFPDDPRIVRQYLALEAIATSSAQNDTGLFELNFRDERYLPFEFAGAVSRWRIELPRDNNAFDMESISELILHLNYTAREGGHMLRKAANELAQHKLSVSGVRFFDLRHEFPDAWYRFHNDRPEHGHGREISIHLNRGMFPFLPGAKPLFIDSLHLFLEAPDACPDNHLLLEFIARPAKRHHDGDDSDRGDGEVHWIDCVAGSEWRGLFHGAMDLHWGPLHPGEDRELGVCRFPGKIGYVSKAFLVCKYRTGDPYCG